MKNPENILITGASSGLGKALALAYARGGVTIYINGRHQERLEETASLCRMKGARVHTMVLDVSDKEGMTAWVMDCDSKYGLDLVIANAGISDDSLVENLEEYNEVYDIFATNVYGVFNTVIPALELMCARKKGQIGIVSSLAGYRGLPSAPAYSSSKAAVKAWGEGLRPLLSDCNVGLSVICPGFIRTNMTANVFFPMPMLVSSEKAARIIKKGLQKNRPRIVFPMLAGFLVWFGAILTPAIGDLFYKKLPKK